jgi:integrase
MEARVLPVLGARRLADVRRGDLQRMVDHWLAEGLSPNSVRNHLNPLRIVYRRALAHEDAAVNPTSNLQLPSSHGTRERFATAAEMEALIDAWDEDRALWAVAAYAGLRRGELRALRWEEVDFDHDVIRVRRTWDRVVGPKRPKSRAGVRDLPMIAPVRRGLLEHRLGSGRRAGLVFGRDHERAFDPSTVVDRARRAWKQEKLTPIGLHECRHTFASLMIAAMAGRGTFNPKVLQTLMGHSTITVTYDRYGHLFPGSETEAGAALEAYLDMAGDGVG